MSKIYQFKTKVYYEDTDAGGIVYYANYLKFIERARTEMIYQKIGLKLNQIKKEFNTIFVVKSCEINFLKAARFEDDLVIFTEILKKTPVRLNLSQIIKRRSEIMVTSSIELAVVNERGLVQKLPEMLYKKI